MNKKKKIFQVTSIPSQKPDSKPKPKREKKLESEDNEPIVKQNLKIKNPNPKGELLKQQVTFAPMKGLGKEKQVVKNPDPSYRLKKLIGITPRLKKTIGIIPDPPHHLKKT